MTRFAETALSPPAEGVRVSEVVLAAGLRTVSVLFSAVVVGSAGVSSSSWFPYT